MGYLSSRQSIFIYLDNFVCFITVCYCEYLPLRLRSRSIPPKGHGGRVGNTLSFISHIPLWYNIHVYSMVLSQTLMNQYICLYCTYTKEINMMNELDVACVWSTPIVGASWVGCTTNAFAICYTSFQVTPHGKPGIWRNCWLPVAPMVKILVW